MPESLDLALRVRPTRRLVKLDAVDDVAAVAWQFLAVPLLHRRRAGLCELPGDAADFHHRHCSGIGEHHRHLQEDAQEVADIVGADVVGAVLGEGFGAIATLQQESLSRRDAAERFLQAAGFARKHERRKGRKALFHRGERLLVRIFGNLGDRLLPPAVARPTLGHERPPLPLSPGRGEIFPLKRAYTRRPACQARSNRAHQRAAPSETRCYSAASRRRLSAFSRSVTSSSATVGCTAITASTSALVAFIFTAIPMSWIISPASGPTIWQPTMRSVAASTTSLKKARASRAARVIFNGRNEVLYTSTFASCSHACASVRPMAPTSGSEKTAVGTSV